MTGIRRLALTLLLPLAACRAHGGMPVPDVSAGGETGHFGPGIESIRREGAELVLRLDTAAHVAVVRIPREGPASLVHVAQFAAGRHIVDLPIQLRETMGEATHPPRGVGTLDLAPSLERVSSFCQSQPAALAPANMQLESAWMTANRCSSVYHRAAVRYRQAGRTASFQRRTPDVIVVIATDFALDPVILQKRLDDLPEIDIGLAALALPELLVGDRTGTWAGYRAER